ncbi:MAG: cysteine desulfurase NifS [Candidatus Diapherotrites archaeon]|nr:cysteine desulfurase NifS [Candidatus Diapherotrites archaeon]
MIYLDHAATTPVDKEVLKEMLPFFSKKYGNASSLHKLGQEARLALENARERIANLINASTEEIIFTSGGTESDNLALRGIAYANKEKGRHIIVSSIEHHAILNTAEDLEKEGFKVTYLPVDSFGLVDVEEIKKQITKETILVSVMHANNEIGTIEPIGEIAEVCKEKNVYFHSDAVQTFGKLKIDVNKTPVDLLSLSAHKIYGPKGIGALYIRKGTKIKSIITGGPHEKNLRAGTENVALAVGFAKASEITHKNMEKHNERMKRLRDYAIKKLSEIENSLLNGHPTKRLSNNINIIFRGVEGESLVTLLSKDRIMASTGSACSSKSLEPSHVLLAIGRKHEEAHGSLRLTLGKDNTKEEIDYAIERIEKNVEKLRKISAIS